MEDDRQSKDRCAPRRTLGEREVSVRTGEAILSALRGRGYDASRHLRRPRHRSGAAADAHRRRVPGAARPLRRGRLRAGAARGAGDPLHRLERARVGAGDEQGQGQGDLPRCTTCPRRRATSRGRRRGEDVIDNHGSFGFPVVVKPAGEGLVAGRARRARRAGAGGGGRGGAALRRRRAGRAVRRG